MKVITFLFCSLLCAFGAHSLEASKKNVLCQAPFSPSKLGPKIRVLLEKDAKSALLEVRGPYAVVRKDTAEILSSGQSGKRFVVHALHDGLRWGEEYPDIFSIAVVPSSADTMMYVNGIQYKGAISVFQTHNMRVTIVNDVPVEDFLKSTLTMELNAPLSKEALNAFVIASRTNISAKMQSARATKRPWDLTAQDCNYLGYAVLSEKNWLEESVDATKFMVLEQGDQSYVEVALTPEKAEEFASRGFDAKKILQTIFPKAHLSVTATPRPVAVR